MAEAAASLVRTGSGVTAYRVEGGGPPIILLHGLQIGQELFDVLRMHLTASFTVITYDQRDRGGTVFKPSAYSTDDLADDLAALIDALGIARAHVLGASFGGMVAQAFALRHPARLDGLVLGATSQAPFRSEQVSGPVADVLDALERGDEQRARAVLQRMAPAADAARTGSASPVSGRSEALMRRFAATRSFDTRGRLGEVDARTLVIHGRDDSAVPLADVLSMAAEMPRADVLLLAGCGHSWENERPRDAAAAIAAFFAGSSPALATRRG